MARIRSLKPDVWMSPQVMNLTHGARLLFIGLITQADDEGRGSADLRRLKASIFGGDDITSADVRRMLDECSTQGLAEIYEAENHGLVYALPSWKSHQSIDRPRKSTYPEPSTRRTVVEPSPSPRRGLEGKEGNGEEGKEGYPRAREANRDLTPVASPSTRAHAFADAELMDAFAVVRSSYPNFSGRQDWPNAEHHWRMRVEQGATPHELIAGVERYAAYVEAGGVSGPGFVMTPGKFFSAVDKPWSQPWTPPPSKAETRLGKNLTAAEEFMRRTEPAA